MKNPNSAKAVEAFQVTSTATVTSQVDATLSPNSAIENQMWFRWCMDSNSIQPISLCRGSIADV